MREMSCLFAKHPIVVNPKLATEIGLNEAIVVQQLNCQLNSKSTKTIVGKKWIYKTYEKWQKDNFPFWSISTIRRTIESLKKLGIISTRKFNKQGLDNTQWYSLDEENLNRAMSRPSVESDVEQEK